MPPSDKRSIGFIPSFGFMYIRSSLAVRNPFCCMARVASAFPAKNSIHCNGAVSWTMKLRLPKDVLIDLHIACYLIQATMVLHFFSPPKPIKLNPNQCQIPCHHWCQDDRRYSLRSRAPWARQRPSPEMSEAWPMAKMVGRVAARTWPSTNTSQILLYRDDCLSTFEI